VLFATAAYFLLELDRCACWVEMLALHAIYRQLKQMCPNPYPANTTSGRGLVPVPETLVVGRDGNGVTGVRRPAG
jgi:hypothetical protein